MVGVTEGCEVESGAGEEAFEQAGPALHPFELGLDQPDELAEVAFGEVGQGSVRCDQSYALAPAVPARSASCSSSTRGVQRSCWSPAISPGNGTGGMRRRSRTPSNCMRST